MALVGFYLIEGWSILDSLYVSAQTVTTVGYGDLTPATRNGRIFSTVFMLAGVGVVLYALTTTVQAIVQSELVATFGQRRQSRKMSKLRNHFIICGAGRVGSHLVRALLGSAETFIVIERDPQRVAELIDLGVIVLVRDATLEESLREAGVEHARGLAACLPDDADNVYVVLTARDLNPQLHIVARAAEEQAEPKLIRAGANRVVAPTIIGGHRMAMALTKPAVDDFLGSITANKLELAFEQLEVDACFNSGRTKAKRNKHSLGTRYRCCQHSAQRRADTFQSQRRSNNRKRRHSDCHRTRGVADETRRRWRKEQNSPMSKVQCPKSDYCW